MVNSIQWQEATSLSEAIAQLSLIGDVRQSPLVALMNTLAWQGKTGEKGEALADSIVDSAKKLVGRKKYTRQFIEQAQGPKGPLEDVFGPLTGFMEGKEGTGSNGNLSFQSLAGPRYPGAAEASAGHQRPGSASDVADAGTDRIPRVKPST